MAAVMLSFMWKMYRGPGVKIAVLAGAIVAAAVLLYVNRSQALIGDMAFIRR